MNSYKKLLLANKAWSKEKLDLKEDFFENMSKGQSPEFLWIGCSDSRVPAEEITGTQPGDLFRARNIANLVVTTDLNLLSVLQYAVHNLKVRHIIICGHYGCGGVQAALSNQTFGLLNEWLRNIKDVYSDNSAELDLYKSDPEKRFRRTVELNVIAQARNLTRTNIVQDAWNKEQRPSIHGWVYGLNTGQLEELIRIDPNSPMEDIYKFEDPNNN